MKGVFFCILCFISNSWAMDVSEFNSRMAEIREGMRNMVKIDSGNREEQYLGFLALVAGQESETFNWDAQAEDLGSEETYRELVKNSIGEYYSSELDHWRLSDGTIGRLYSTLLVQRADETTSMARLRLATANQIDITKADSFIVNKLREQYTYYHFFWDLATSGIWRERYEENKPSSEELKADFLRRKDAEEKEDHTTRDALLLSAGLASGTVAGLFSLYALARSMYRGWSFTRWACLAVILLLCVAVAAGHELSPWEPFTPPYGFYIFLRLAVALLSAWLAYVAVVRKKSPVLVLFSVLLALLYQPLVKVALEVEVWQWVNMASIPVLFLLAFFITRHEHKTP